VREKTWRERVEEEGSETLRLCARDKRNNQGGKKIKIFFILFGYVGEKESCFGVWFSQGVISGDPLVFGFLRYRPKPRSFGFVFFFSVFIWSLGFCNLLLGVH
jgi:hypothetical protein